METDVDQGYRTVCTTCLSSDRDLFDLSSMPQIQEILNLLLYDFTRDRLDLPEITYLICWECLAMLKRMHRFKWQVQNAQEHLRLLALSLTQEAEQYMTTDAKQIRETLRERGGSEAAVVFKAEQYMTTDAKQIRETLRERGGSEAAVVFKGDHTYLSQSLSTLGIETKAEYDKIFFDYSTNVEEFPRIISVHSHNQVKSEYEVQTIGNVLDMEGRMLEMSDIDLDNSTTRMPHIIVDSNYNKAEGRGPCLTIEPLKIDPDPAVKLTYTTEYMSEADMIMAREEAKKKIQYASSVYKCELCIIGFYTQQQVEDHFENAHRAKPGLVSCKICYLYTEEGNIDEHTRQHYMRFGCKLCDRIEYSERLIQIHGNAHSGRAASRDIIPIQPTKVKKKKKKQENTPPPKPGDLRKLLSKTTIEGYKCLECDMFFKNSRARKNHVARFHREGLQCDHCKKRFVNKGTLTTHLKLHEGPLPKEECPICHKMVRTIQIKYHIQRHQNKSRYECKDCNKIFSHLATYHAHLKYSRAHASESVLKFPCPMCNKGYPTKETMQDHFNYQHLGKTAHKCPICEKPIASRSNVEKHIARVHGEKKPKPRNHVCDTCGKSFTDKKALNQHEAIHLTLRPLVCDICQMTFKQKASLYTHRKRVHKVTPVKKEVFYMDKMMGE